MAAKTPLTVYYHDHGHFSIYKLSLAQINELLEKEEGDPWETINKFEVEVDFANVGYAPDAMVTLGELCGFDVESI